MKQSPIRRSHSLVETCQPSDTKLALAQLTFFATGMSKFARVRRENQEVKTAGLQVRMYLETSSLSLSLNRSFQAIIKEKKSTVRLEVAIANGNIRKSSD